MINNRVAFILGSKFPTVKAYGVTTRETVNVLSREGYSVRVYAMYSEYSDADYKSISKNIRNLHKNRIIDYLISKGEIDLKKIGQLSWNFGLILSIVTSRKMIKSFKPEIIWLRDPLIAFLCLRMFSKSQIVLEVHYKFNRMFVRTLTKNSNRVLFCPINLENGIFLKSAKQSFLSVLSPMAIRADQLPLEQEVSAFVRIVKQKKGNNLKIGYVGKLFPQGYSKGFEELIMLAKFYQDNSINNEVTIVGATAYEMKICLSMQKDFNIGEKFLKFQGHVSHSDALRIMKQFDILVLPVPIDTKYIGMPLKLLEYLSAGRITVIQESKLLSGFLKGKYQPNFYSRNSPGSLHVAIISAIDNSRLREQILDGIDFASSFTWERRTKRILSNLKS
jgi:hypothetical protein